MISIFLTKVFKKCLFEYENQFAVEKKNTKSFLRAISKIQKNASHTFSIYGNCMISIFLTKVFLFFSTIHRILCQNKRKVRRHHISKRYEICMICVFS